MEDIQEGGREAYAALLFGLSRTERTGILELHHGRTWRKVYLVRGTPVLYESSLDSERLSKTILQAGLVAKKPLAKVVAGLQPGELLEARLLSEGLVGPEELHAHKQSFLERGAAASLAWSHFSFCFRANDSVGEAIDPALLPLVQPLRGLWAAARQHLTIDEVLPLIDDKEAGDIQATDILEDVLNEMAVEAPMEKLSSLLAEGDLPFEELFSKVGDKSGSLPTLIWLLESIGAIRRTSRASNETRARLVVGKDLPAEEPLFPSGAPVAEDGPDTKAPTATGTGQPQSEQNAERKAEQMSALNRTAAHLPELLSTARAHRSGKDFYAFLDLVRSS